MTVRPVAVTLLFRGEALVLELTRLFGALVRTFVCLQVLCTVARTVEDLVAITDGTSVSLGQLALLTACHGTLDAIIVYEIVRHGTFGRDGGSVLDGEGLVVGQ